jgi:branched-chain amino acid transport system ATP-binding protein
LSTMFTEDPPAKSVMPLLTVQKLTKTFGGLTAVNDISFELEKNDILSVIGPNGAGKTTLFNMLTGIYQPTEGQIVLQKEGKACTLQGLKSHQINQEGLARTFQNIRLFNKMTVLENVMVGRHVRTNNGLWAIIIPNRKARIEEEQTIEQAMEKLEFVGLEDKAFIQADSLSYGDQRRLEIARALATDPTILLLDEPAAGMNPQEKKQLIGLIRRIQEKGVTIILIEHDMGLVMNISDHIVVMNFGQKICEGTPEVVRENPEVIKAYLGA